MGDYLDAKDEEKPEDSATIGDSAAQHPFKLANGVSIPAVSMPDLSRGLAELAGEFGVAEIQTIEAGGYSMAMVIRSALALSAEAGRVCVLAADCLAGYVALSALRQLVNAGADGYVILFSGFDDGSETFRQMLNPIDKLGVPIAYWSVEERASLETLVGECHNVILGLWGAPFSASNEALVLSELLNELATPVHAIHCTLGIDADSGDITPSALYPSSTLSLGAPLAGLSIAKDFVGRHYLCDISFTRIQYRGWGFPDTPLFAEQPVIRILPVETE